eukprot:gene21863-biopygen19207
MAFREWLDWRGPNRRIGTVEYQFCADDGDSRTHLIKPPAIHLRHQPPTRAEIITALRGKNLACWCRPCTPCHADTLIEIANQEARP